MNWMAPYGNIRTIIAPFPLYKPRKPSFFGTAFRVENTPAKEDGTFHSCGPDVWKETLIGLLYLAADVSTQMFVMGVMGLKKNLDSVKRSNSRLGTASCNT